MKVTWTGDTLDKLANLYVDSIPHERDVIAAAVQRINVQLKLGPWTLGESREGWERIWFHYPLAIKYEIFPNDDEVVVFDVIKLNPQSGP